MIDRREFMVDAGAVAAWCAWLFSAAPAVAQFIVPGRPRPIAAGGVVLSVPGLGAAQFDTGVEISLPQLGAFQS